MTIHIGMPKCGSTSLQCNYFAQLPEITYLGPDSIHFDEEMEQKTKYLMALSGMEESLYRKISGNVREYLYSYFDASQKSIISDEGITTAFYGGVPEACNDRTLIAGRYHELFPDAKILMIIRNQFDFLQSLFGEWNRRKFVNYPDFHQWIAENIRLENNLISNPLRLPDYLSIYDIYTSLYDKNRVKVMTLEHLSHDPDDFFKELSDYLEINLTLDLLDKAKQRVNTRTSVLGKMIISLDFRFPIFRKIIPRDMALSFFKLAEKISPVLDTTYTSKEHRLINDFYADSNKRLELATGLPLQSLGYPYIEN